MGNSEFLLAKLQDAQPGKEVEPRNALTYLDERGTFTHMAAVALKRRPQYENALLFSEETIPQMFGAVASGRAKYAIVPIENSSDGKVRQTHEGLEEHDLQVVDELVLDVVQVAYSQKLSFSKDTIWASKKSALGQCQENIERVMREEGVKPKDIKYIETNSTTEAVRMAAHNPNIAAIGSVTAASEQGLEDKFPAPIHGFNDRQSNATTFVVLRQKGELPPPTGNDKTTFIMTIDDSKGKLVEALDIIAEHDINLNKIKSTSKKGGGVSFLVSGDGHELDENMGSALKALEESGVSIKRLGSYPKAEYVAKETEDTFNFSAAIRRIEDEAKNGEAMDRTKRIIVFTLIDQHGLRNALRPFTEADVNLTAIDSQPSGIVADKLHEQHIFYLAFDKTTEDGDRLIEELASHCTHVRELQPAAN